MIQIIPINNQTPDEHFLSYHECTHEILGDNPLAHLFFTSTLDKFKEISLKRSTRLDIYLLLHQEECLGIIEHLKQSEYACINMIRFDLLVDATTTIRSFLQKISANRTLRITTSQQKTCELLTSIGGNCVIQDVIQELQIAELNIPQLEQLFGEAQSKKQAGINFYWHSFLEGELLDKYIAFHNEIQKQIPVFDMENGEKEIDKEMLLNRYKGIKKQGGGMHYLLAINNNKEIIGLTEVYYVDKNNVEQISSGLTAVKKEYRQQKIAQFLKISMLRKMLKLHPKLTVIDTANSVVNMPILQLNKKIGFEAVGNEYIVDFS